MAITGLDLIATDSLNLYRPYGEVFPPQIGLMWEGMNEVD